MNNRINAQRTKIAARLANVAAQATQLRSLAETYSETARAAFAETASISVEKIKLFLPRLPKEFEGFRVVQLTDIHHSPFVDRHQVSRAVAMANELQGDLVVLTGDYISHEPEYIEPVAELLSALESKNGIYAVLGNHDHWTDAKAMTEALRARSITVFVNQGAYFTRGDAKIWICGVDDFLAQAEDLPAALKGAQKSDFKLLLAHNPVILPRAADASVDLVLSGHTHGGQVRFRPTREGLFRPSTRRAAGLFTRKTTQMYISRGLGTVVLPFRYQCPPEITLLELYRASH